MEVADCSVFGSYEVLELFLQERPFVLGLDFLTEPFAKVNCFPPLLDHPEE